MLRLLARRERTFHGPGAGAMLSSPGDPVLDSATKYLDGMHGLPAAPMDAERAVTWVEFDGDRLFLSDECDQSVEAGVEGDRLV